MDEHQQEMLVGHSLQYFAAHGWQNQLISLYNQVVFHIVNQFVIHLRSEEHTSELQSRGHLVCRLLLEKAPRPPRAPLFPYTTLFRSASPFTYTALYSFLTPANG